MNIKIQMIPLLPPKLSSLFKSVKCLRFKLIAKEELAVTEHAKRTKITDGSFSMVIQFGHCEREELTHCNSHLL